MDFEALSYLILSILCIPMAIFCFIKNRGVIPIYVIGGIITFIHILFMVLFILEVLNL
jgi:hypothetical protein